MPATSESGSPISRSQAGQARPFSSFLSKASLRPGAGQEARWPAAGVPAGALTPESRRDLAGITDVINAVENRPPEARKYTFVLITEVASGPPAPAQQAPKE